MNAYPRKRYHHQHLEATIWHTKLKSIHQHRCLKCREEAAHQGRLQRREAKVRDDLTAKGGDTVGEVAEESKPEEEVALWVKKSLSKLRPLERLVVNAGVVVANHLNRCYFLVVTEELGAALRRWEEDVDYNRPEDADGADDEIDPLPRSKTASMDVS